MTLLHLPYLIAVNPMLWVRLILLCSGTQSETAIPYEKIAITCLTPDVRQELFIISSQDDYNAIEQLRMPSLECTDLPKIDFSKNLLIGYRVSTTGCKDPDFALNIMKSLNKYEATLTLFKQRGSSCRIVRRSVCWFTIAKPTDGYTLNISLKKPE